MFNLLLSQDQPATLINMIHDLKTGVNMDGKKKALYGNQTDTKQTDS